jgi:transposase
VPKSHDGVIEAIRVLRVARRSAIKARTQCVLQIRDLLVTAPTELRQALEPLEITERVARLTRFRPGDVADPAEATKQALRCLARRYQALTGELDQLDEHLDRLTAQANPALRGAHGVGVDVAGALLVAAGDNPDRLRSEAAFAALCGVSPVEASSGKIVRHRLNRGGNREANNALWRIVMVRLSCDPATRTYRQTRRAEGKTDREIMRCLKRYVAREVYRHLTRPHSVHTGAELRAQRTRLGISLETAARPLRSWATRLSRLERGLDHDTQLAERYHTWLTEQAA